MEGLPVLQLLRGAAARVFDSTDILVAYAHGSYVTGRPRQDSDLDVGFYLRKHRAGRGLPLGEELRLASELSDAVGVTVDLRNLGDAPLDVKGRVLEEGVRIYSSDDVARVALERDLLGRYHDYKFELSAMHEMRLRTMADRGL
jgi:predicted nucleotidyltransferase